MLQFLLIHLLQKGHYLIALYYSRFSHFREREHNIYFSLPKKWESNALSLIPDYC